MFKIICNFIVEKFSIAVTEGIAPKRDRSKVLTKQLPGYYGRWYLLLIPLFGVLYWIPFFELEMGGHSVNGFLELLYFSAVTITTLGYGDITPNNIPAMLLTGTHSVFGVGLIGLFLTSLSFQHSKEAQQIARDQIKKDFDKTVDEIRTASMKMVNQMTGGNSYPLMTFSKPSPDDDRWSYRIQVKGDYPIHDLEYEIININGWKKNPLTELGTVMPGNKGAHTMTTVTDKKLISFIVIFSARNGYFVQEIKHKLLDTGDWVSSDWINAHWYDEEIQDEQILINKHDSFPEGRKE